MMPVNTIPTGFGERLREERLRLGLSQADLAQKMGIHKNTQARYEKADTQPPTGYLTALRCLGIDTDYILSGVRASGEGAAHRALVHLVGVILDTLRLTPHEKEFEHICQLAYNETAAIWRDGEIRGEAADRATAALIKKSPLFLEEGVLFDLIERLEFVLGSKEISITPLAKAEIIFRLYQQAKIHGQPIDLQSIAAVIEDIR